MNQLSIVRNFATLRIKGMRRMAASKVVAWQWHNGTGIHFACWIWFLACHYQLFEQLPTERQGGDRGHSLLNKEDIQVAARAHLSSLPTGDVTLKRFHHALHERILPSLGWILRKLLSEHTARQWLIKLGWQRMMLRKGVYMDGYERPDVVEYQKNDFLPLMALHEKNMVQWLANGTEHIDLKLGPGDKRVITVFQDESSFHINEYKQIVSYAPFLFPVKLIWCS